MTGRIPPEIETEVIRLYLTGLTRDDIASKTNISKGSVSNLITKFSEQLGRLELDATRKLTVNFRKIGITAVEAFAGARISNVLKMLGLDDDQLHSFLSTVYDECKKIDLHPTTLVGCAAKLLQLQTSSDVPVEEIPDNYEKLLNEIQTLKQKIITLTQEARQAKCSYEQAVNNKNLTLEILKEYAKSREELIERGVEIEDLPKLANMLDQASHLKFDTKEIIEYIKQEKHFDQRIIDLQNEIEGLVNEERSLIERAKKLKAEIDAQQFLVSELEMLTSIGVTSGYLEELHRVINGIGKAQGIDSTDAMQKFKDDILNHYDEKLGLERILIEIKEGVSSNSKELDSLELKLENLKLKYKQMTDAIHIVEQLEKEGISPKLIACWNRILTLSNVTPENLEQELRIYGDLNKGITKTKQQINRMQKEERSLESVIKTLANQKEELEASIRHTKEFTIRQLKEVGEEAKNSIQTVTKSTADSIAVVTSDAKKDLENIISSLDSIVTEVSKASEDFGRLEALKPIHRIISECKGEKHEVYPAILVLLHRFGIWLQAQNTYTYAIRSSVDRVADDIGEEMKRIAEKNSN